MDVQTGKDIAERMRDYHTRAVMVASQADSIIGNAHFDIKPPILVIMTAHAYRPQGRSARQNAYQ